MIARLMAADNQIDFDHANGPGLSAAAERQRPRRASTRSIAPSPTSTTTVAHAAHRAPHPRRQRRAVLQQAGRRRCSLVAELRTNDKCELFEIDDLALFYILNMASTNASTRHNAERRRRAPTSASHITDGDRLIGARRQHHAHPEPDRHQRLHAAIPTPAALNRSLFLRTATQVVVHAGHDRRRHVHRRRQVHRRARQVDLRLGDEVWSNAPSGNANSTLLHGDPAGRRRLRQARRVRRRAIRRRCSAPRRRTRPRSSSTCSPCCTTHWASPQSSYFGAPVSVDDRRRAPRFSYADNVVSYEPLMTEVLGQADLMPAHPGAGADAEHHDRRRQGGQPAGAAVRHRHRALPVRIRRGAARHHLSRRHDDDHVKSDGTGTVPLTPYYLMADAFAHKRAALAPGDADQAGAWKAATSALVDQMLTVQKNANGTYQFQTAASAPSRSCSSTSCAARIAAHVTAGDIDAWAHQTLTQDITEQLGGPTFAALADFTAKVETDPDARNQLYGLLQYLVDEADNDLVFQTALTTLADQVQMFLDDPDLVPVARMLGAALDPQRGAVDAQLTLIKRAHDLDTNKAFLTIARNLYKQDTDGVYPASNLADVLSELNRAQPGAGRPARRRRLQVDPRRGEGLPHRRSTRFHPLPEHRQSPWPALARSSSVVVTSLVSLDGDGAGGMFLPFRGARATGRAGAFTAGVDDASALYYNPAGMADIDGWSFLIDGALVLQRVGYDRVDSGGNPQPHVDGSMNVLPLPTIALTYKPRTIKGRWVTLRLRRVGAVPRHQHLAGERAAALQQHLDQRLAPRRRRAGGVVPHQGVVLARRRPAEHDPALPQPPDALGLLGAQLRAGRSGLRRAHRRSTPTRRSRRRASSARSSRSPSSASASTCSCRSSCARRARWRRGCRPIRSSPTPRSTATASASTSTCR